MIKHLKVKNGNWRFWVLLFLFNIRNRISTNTGPVCTLLERWIEISSFEQAMLPAQRSLCRPTSLIHISCVGPLNLCVCNPCAGFTANLRNYWRSWIVQDTPGLGVKDRAGITSSQSKDTEHQGFQLPREHACRYSQLLQADMRGSTSL